MDFEAACERARENDAGLVTACLHQKNGYDLLAEVIAAAYAESFYAPLLISECQHETVKSDRLLTMVEKMIPVIYSSFEIMDDPSEGHRAFCHDVQLARRTTSTKIRSRIDGILTQGADLIGASQPDALDSPRPTMRKFSWDHTRDPA